MFDPFHTREAELPTELPTADHTGENDKIYVVRNLDGFILAFKSLTARTSKSLGLPNGLPGRKILQQMHW